MESYATESAPGAANSFGSALRSPCKTCLRHCRQRPKEKRQLRNPADLLVRPEVRAIYGQSAPEALSEDILLQF